MFTACHPGATNTDLGRHLGFASFLGPILGQKAGMGALPTLRAATDPTAKSGDYFGPKNFFQWRGYPVQVKSNAMSHNTEKAKKLWDLSEQLTGVNY